MREPIRPSPSTLPIPSQPPVDQPTRSEDWDFCSRCRRQHPDVTVAAHIEAVSGPGWFVLACPDCLGAVRRRLGTRFR